MKNRANIFYFMHISWKWAKQRPQFLAECLSKDYFVNVAQKKDYRSKNFEGKLLKHIKLIYLFLLPYNSRSELSRFFNTIIIKLFYRKSYFESKIIWVTSPELYWILPKRKPGQLLVYDCMDDMLSFDDIRNNPKIHDFYQIAERRLLTESDIVFSSSDHLKDVLVHRYKLQRDIHVVNNGLTLNVPLGNESENILRRDHTKVNLVYIGTVSKWMDWDLILTSLKNDSTLLYHIVGPIEYDGPKHENIMYYGGIDHHQVFQVMRQADILIMPFVVNDLIKSVNPVKLYEYIYSGKAVLSVDYPETGKFSEFVWLYNGAQEYGQLLTHIKQSQFVSKKSHFECKEFCQYNNWENRYDVVKQILTSAKF